VENSDRSFVGDQGDHREEKKKKQKTRVTLGGDKKGEAESYSGSEGLLRQVQLGGEKTQREQGMSSSRKDPSKGRTNNFKKKGANPAKAFGGGGGGTETCYPAEGGLSNITLGTENRKSPSKEVKNKKRREQRRNC